jgi:SAM-dependent methyltransferase
MELGAGLHALYDGYYASGEASRKRLITAQQTFDHVQALLGDRHPTTVIDVGSGDGAVLQVMADRNFADTYDAVEISASGLDAIRARNIAGLREAKLFDGYRIPYPDAAFDLGLAVHVLEHVEHERTFIHELLRVSKACYVEVPLELTFRTKRAIGISAKYGHINFYTKETFRNLLETSGAVVKHLAVFAHGRELETYLGGKWKGMLKYRARTSLLKAMPWLAPWIFVYMCGAVITKR